MCSDRPTHGVIRPAVCSVLIVGILASFTTAQSDGDNNGSGSQRLGSLTSVRDIKHALNEMTPTELEQLRRKSDQFNRLSRADRDKARRMHQAIMASASADRTYNVLKRYQDWLASLPATDREELLALPPAKRIEAIRQRHDEMNGLAAGDLNALSPQDSRAFVSWLHNYINENYDTLVMQLPRPLQVRLRDAQPSPRRSIVMATQLFNHHGQVSSFSETPEALDTLHAALSGAGQAQLKAARENSQVKELFAAWIQELRVRMASINISDARFLQFFQQELSSAEQNRLEALPPDQMRQQLRQLFMERRMKRRRP